MWYIYALVNLFFAFIIICLLVMLKSAYLKLKYDWWRLRREENERDNKLNGIDDDISFIYIFGTRTYIYLCSRARLTYLIALHYIDSCPDPHRGALCCTPRH